MLIFLRAISLFFFFFFCRDHYFSADVSFSSVRSFMLYIINSSNCIWHIYRSIHTVSSYIYINMYVQKNILENCKTWFDRRVWEPSIHLYTAKLIVVDLLRFDQVRRSGCGYCQWFWEPCGDHLRFLVSYLCSPKDEGINVINTWNKY